jgi:hypothetical protein
MVAVTAAAAAPGAGASVSVSGQAAPAAQPALAVAAAQAVASAAPAAQPLRPPVVAEDFPDPALLWGGDAFYAFATNAGGLNVPVVRSRNLYDWSEPVDAVPVLPAWAVPGMTWAPAAVAIGGHYVLYISTLHVFGAHCIARLVSDSPAGPYVTPVETPAPLFCNEVGGTGAIDPNPIVEPDGRVFLLWKAEGARSQQIWSIELSPDGMWPVGTARHLLTATSRWEAGGVENPAMVLAGGRHLLFYSGNYWSGGSYAIGYATCDGPLGPCHKQTTSGPWVSSANSAVGPGGSSFASGPDGQLWMAVHGWTSGAVGYKNRGERQLHVEPVDVSSGAPALVNRAPDGGLERAARAPGGVAVGGWAIDPDTGAPIGVQVQLNGRPLGDLTGSARRPDIGSSRPQAGPDHGFGATLGIAAGSHQLCVAALDDLGAAATPLGCATVDVTTEPAGILESVVAIPGGARAGGWAVDPDTAGPIDVHIYVDRAFFGIATASLDHGTIAEAYPGYGSAHGWSANLALPFGGHQVCAYAIDTGDEPSVPLGCQSVLVTRER